MERLYNGFTLRYFNVNPTIETGTVFPVLDLCPGMNTHVYHQKKKKVTPGDTKVAAPSLMDLEQDDGGSDSDTSLLESFSVESSEKLQGTFTIQVANLKLSEKCITQLAKAFGENCIIFFKWKFLKFPKTTTPFERLSVRRHGQIYDFIITYDITVNFSVYKSLVNKMVCVELHASNEYKEDAIAVGFASFEAALDNVGKVETCNVTIQERLSGLTFAQLKLSIQLECNAEILQVLKAKFKENAYFDKADKAVTDIYKIKTTSPSTGQYDILNYHSTLNTVLTRSNTLKISRSEVSTELKDRVKWLHQECNWKRSLQEYAILRGDDPYAIKDYQWKTNDTKEVKLRNYITQPKNILPELIIFIDSVRLKKNSHIMKDDNIKKIYVEYDFLSYKGQELETPMSMKKKENITFHFKKRFKLDPEANECDCKLLAHQIRNNQNIQFNVIGEPQFKANIPILSCKKLADCRLSLLELVGSLTDEATLKCNLTSIYNTAEIVGQLVISFQGLLAMRKAALIILAPPGYDLIE